MARSAGFISMFTGSYLAYFAMQKNGFTFLPYGIHKIRQYTILFGVAFLSYHFASSFVATMTGDNDQLAYLLRHKNGILFGKKLYDRPQPYITAQDGAEKK